MIIDQVRNGVAVRMAVLFLLLGAGRSTDAERWRRLDACRGADDARGQGRRGGRRHRRARAPTSSSTTAASSPSAPTSTATRVLDAGGCVVAPGLVDLHAHLRQPGREEAETIETGSRGRGPRRLHRGRRHAQHRAGHRLAPAVVREVLELGGQGAVRRARVGGHHRRPRRRAAGADGGDGRRSACGCSPTTATACRTTG